MRYGHGEERTHVYLQREEGRQREREEDGAREHI